MFSRNSLFSQSIKCHQNDYFSVDFTPLVWVSNIDSTRQGAMSNPIAPFNMVKFVSISSCYIDIYYMSFHEISRFSGENLRHHPCISRFLVKFYPNSRSKKKTISALFEIRVESSARNWRRSYSWSWNTRMYQRIQTYLVLNSIFIYL